MVTSAPLRVFGQATLSAVLAAPGAWVFAQPGVSTPVGSTSEETVALTVLSAIGHLEGEWIRNPNASEDPIQKTMDLWRDPDRMSAVLLALSRSLAERVGRLRISLDDGHVRLRNAQFEILEFPADGSPVADRYGNRHRTSVLPGILEVETARPGWLLIETVYTQESQLHRVIEIQSDRFPNLRFLTVYDRYGPEPPLSGPTGDDFDRSARPAAVRIVPPRSGHHELLTGRVEVGTLIGDKTIETVEFFLDGRRRQRVRKPPYRARLQLGDPPREQTLEVRAYSSQRVQVGGDRVVLNRVDPPFAVRIGAVVPPEGASSTIRVETTVAVPRGAVLDRIDFYLGEQLVETAGDLARHGAMGGFRTVTGNLPADDLSPQDYVRVAATLVDGRQLEDAELLQGVEFKGEIDVQLIHLQVLVVDAEGAPVGGLRAADFRIVEDGEHKVVKEVQTAADVPLLLGMAIDSSASMKPVWQQLRSIAGAFLDGSLAAEDRAFLVDFDETIRLLQPLTEETSALRKRLERLVPNGGTALNDGVLFSLLQYGSQPGRRALVVVTDGVDIDSRSEPELAGAFAEQTGIPLYFIDLGKDRTSIAGANAPEGEGTGTPQMRVARSGTHLLRMRQLARRSGGRLFRIDLELRPQDFAARAREVFDRIREDLRSQHVLTYYSDRPLGAAIEPEVRTIRTDLQVRSALPLQVSDGR